MPYQDLMLPKSLHEYTAARQDVVDKLTQAGLILEMASDKMCEFGAHGLSCDAKPRDSLSRSIKKVDADFWRVAFDKTGVNKLMDYEAKQKFLSSLENPPPFTMDNIQEQFLTLSQEAEGMFIRGVVNVFRRLTDHKTNTNEPFKINQKAILSYMFSRWCGPLHVQHSGYGSAGADLLNDIDRVIKTLDNEPFHPRSLETAVNAAFAECESQHVYEDDYYKIRGYKNSNGHIWFKRQDLLDEVNKLIGRYFNDNALGVRRAA